MIFCVFSYNRGPFLEHCVATIERCAPEAEIRIYDDGSSDPQTLAVLEGLAPRHRVRRPAALPAGKHGGLYANMQRALEDLEGVPLACFLQDDMQLVRPLDAGEIEGFGALLAGPGAPGFLQPCFLKGAAGKGDAPLRFDAASGLYRHLDRGQSAGIHYSDIFVADPRRLLARGWRFAASEPDNERQAGRLFAPMGYLHAPFAMWLPDAPAWRGKRKTLALRLAERRRNCGFHPFDLLDAERIRALRNRPPEALPFAETWLRCRGGGLAPPWRYYPLQGSRWLKKLNSAELFLRRLLTEP